MAELKPWAMLVIALFLSSCGSQSESIDQDSRVLAQVQGEEITVSWFETTYVNYLLQTGANDNPRNRAIHLDNLIDTILLANEVENRRVTSTESYKLHVARERKLILGARFFETAFLKTLPPPTDEEIRESFVRWKDQLVVRHLFYRYVGDAEAAHERLVAGRDFLEEAQDCYGLSQFDSTAGYLGPIRYYGVDDAFAEAAYGLEPGEFSEPVRSRFGYHIIRVEDRIREALLTESEYQTRRSGLESQFRLRKRRLEGDRFVRSFMEERDVRTRPDAIQALQSLLREFARDVNPRPTVDLSSESRFALDSLKAVMNASTVLATYVWDGEPRDFTAGDYVFWLDKLPFQEALDLAAASVGRAMRNEILAKAGEEAGLDDALTTARLAREGVYERARLIRMEMRQTPEPELDDELVRRAYDHLGVDRKQLYRADFETIPFSSYVEAEGARVELAGRVDALSEWPGYRVYSDIELTELPEWMVHVTTAPIGRPVVVGTSNSWSVLWVTRRSKIEMNWETHQDEILEKVLPYATEYRALKRLRTENPVVADTLLFNQIMVLDLLPALPSR